MYQHRLRHRIGCIAPLHGTHQPPAAPALGPFHQGPRQGTDVLKREGEGAQWVALKTVEAGAQQDQVGGESLGRRVDRAQQRLHVLRRRQGRRHRHVPHRAMRATVVGRPGARIPRPLVHRHEVDTRLVLHQCLRAVAMVHVPVHDQHALAGRGGQGIVRRNRHIAEQAESHRPVAQRVMSRRTHRRKATRRTTIKGHVHAIEHAARSRRGCIP